jgi:hypothetical protein
VKPQDRIGRFQRQGIQKFDAQQQRETTAGLGRERYDENQNY